MSDGATDDTTIKQPDAFNGTTTATRGGYHVELRPLTIRDLMTWDGDYHGRTGGKAGVGLDAYAAVMAAGNAGWFTDPTVKRNGKGLDVDDTPLDDMPPPWILWASRLVHQHYTATMLIDPNEQGQPSEVPTD